jgi:hypothetical protein
LPVTLLLFDWSRRERVLRLARWVGLAVVAAALSQMLYSILRLSPLFHMVGLKDQVFVQPMDFWLSQPFRFLEGNLKGQFDWLRSYMTLPLFVLAMLAAVYPSKSWREKLLLAAWWLIPFVGLANFGRVLYPRFILFMTMPLLVLAGVGILGMVRRLGKFGWLAAAACFVLPLYMDAYILTNPQAAPITKSDKDQYITDWPAGGGVREVNAFLAGEAQKGKITVITEGTFGLMPYAVEIYLVNHPNVEIKSIWPLPAGMPEEYAAASADHPTYFILNQSQVPPADWPLELLAEYQKGNPGNKLRLYRVL